MAHPSRFGWETGTRHRYQARLFWINLKGSLKRFTLFRGREVHYKAFETGTSTSQDRLQVLVNCSSARSGLLLCGGSCFGTGAQAVSGTLLAILAFTKYQGRCRGKSWLQTFFAENLCASFCF